MSQEQGICGCRRGNVSFLSQNEDFTGLSSIWKDVLILLCLYTSSSTKGFYTTAKKCKMQEPPFATCLVYHFYFKVSSNKPGEHQPYPSPPPSTTTWPQLVAAIQ